jgi:very-short-patch-repair endonuclease
MEKYNPRLKPKARILRSNQTEAEQKLWSQVRRKQLLNVQFYRQKPLGEYIVDFYAPAAKLVIELDGSQHLEPEHQAYDQKRTEFLQQYGLTVLRFSNLDVLQHIHSIMPVIFEALQTRLKNPP